MPRATALILVGVLAASSGAAVLAQAARTPAQTPTPPATAEQPPPPPPGKGGFSVPNDDPFPSTYRPIAVAPDRDPERHAS